MKKNIIFFICLTFLFSCKKKTENQNNGFLGNVTATYSTGVKSATLQEILAVPTIDTSQVSIYGRLTGLDQKFELQMPIPGDQGKYNSCLGWAIGYGMLSNLYHKAGVISNYLNKTDLFSSAYIWNQVNGGQNVGDATCIRSLEIIKQQGCCKWILFPPDLMPYSQPIPSSAKDNAINFKIKEYYRIETLNLDIIKSYLFHRTKPLVFAGFVDLGLMAQYQRSWQERGGKKVWYKFLEEFSEVNVNKEKLKHAMIICGYDDTINAFKVMNSWGPSWGMEKNGFFWIDYDFFKKIILKNPSGISDNPELYFAILPIAKQIEVDSKKSWINSGIEIRNGKKYSITQISGGWSVDKNNYPNVSADGHTNEANTPLAGYFSIKTYSSAYFGTLLGKIGNNIFKIGANFNGTIPYEGTLYLQINDEARTDNGGEVTIKITEN